MAEYFRCYKEIDLDIIEKNFDALKGLTKEGVKAMAVVKAMILRTKHVKIFFIMHSNFKS